MKLLHLLFDLPGQTVSALAGQVDLSLPITSQHLRALESRGLLEVRRAGRNVIYRPASTIASPVVAPLLPELRRAFRSNPHAVEIVFKTATAFTHPRRIDIVRVLKGGDRDAFKLRALTRMSRPALYRHLAKLEKRSFVECRTGIWRINEPSDGLGRALLAGT